MLMMASSHWITVEDVVMTKVAQKKSSAWRIYLV